MSKPFSHSRRRALATGVTAMGAMCLNTSLTSLLHAQSGPDNLHKTNTGQISVHPISHASFVMETPDTVVYNDPVGDPSQYAAMPPAQLILLTHEHGDHFNLDTLGALVNDNTRLITNPAVLDKLPGELKERAVAIGNGDSTTSGSIEVTAIPAYNLTEERLKYHPKGRDNGYVLTIDGVRVYIAGDTEAVPEMRDLQDIQIAFIPMNLPYTMGPAQAASGVLDFAPDVVYPYHYKDSDISIFENLVTSSNDKIKVLKGPWYG